MNDTSPEVQAMVRAKLMALSGEQRIEMGTKSFDAARAMVIASMPADLSDLEFKKILFERIYGVSARPLLKLFSDKN